MKHILVLSFISVIILLSYSSCKRCGTCNVRVEIDTNLYWIDEPHITTLSKIEACGEEYKEYRDSDIISDTTFAADSAIYVKTTRYDCY